MQAIVFTKPYPMADWSSKEAGTSSALVSHLFVQDTLAEALLSECFS
jgi:hypothetical protein